MPFKTTPVSLSHFYLPNFFYKLIRIDNGDVAVMRKHHFSSFIIKLRSILGTQTPSMLLNYRKQSLI